MLQGEQLQLIVEATKDRIVGVPGISSSSLIPLQEPGVEAIILRDIHRTIATIENTTKLALYPKRKTELPQSAREAYEDKEKYLSLGAFSSSEIANFPRWQDLTEEQQDVYFNDPTLYSSGTLDWDRMTRKQREFLNSHIAYVPNKSGDIEKIDGKGRAYIKLYNREIIKVHTVTVQSPVKSNGAFMWGRTYTEESLIIHRREGGIQLVPQLASLAMLNGGGAYLATGAMGYGITTPKIPQLIKVDYTYGLKEIPLDLQDAAAMLTAIKVFENVNLLTTQGILGFSVQGFSANFAKGMYSDVMERYEARAQAILDRYQYTGLTGW